MSGMYRNTLSVIHGITVIDIHGTIEIILSIPIPLLWKIITVPPLAAPVVICTRPWGC